MHLSTIYRVDVNAPDDVADRFGHTKEYEQRMLEATKGAAAAGSNHYCELNEWAECDSAAQAEAIGHKMEAVMAYFAAIPKEPEE